MGLTARKCDGVALGDSVLRDCTGGGVRSINSSGVHFFDTRFERNGRGRPGDVVVDLSGERSDIEFVRCRLEQNQPEPGTGLFVLDRQGVFTYFRDGSIEENHAEALASGRASDHLKVEKTKVQTF